MYREAASRISPFREHENLIAPDAVILAAFSPKDKSLLHSTYQKLIERTRYLRRDDYAIGDIPDGTFGDFPGRFQPELAYPNDDVDGAPSYGLASSLECVLSQWQLTESRIFHNHLSDFVQMQHGWQPFAMDHLPSLKDDVSMCRWVWN